MTSSPSVGSLTPVRTDCGRGQDSRPPLGRVSTTRFPDPGRLALLVATAVYALSIYYAYIEYLHPVWEYMGFTFRPLGAFEFIALTAMLGLAGLAMPVRLSHASAAVMMLLYLVVYVPGMVVTFCLDTDRIDRYLPFGVALTLVFVVAGLISSHMGRFTPATQTVRPSNSFVAALFTAWIAMSALLMVEYRDVMSIVALDDVYGQREAGASTSALIAYVQTYLSSVVSPALIAIGLLFRRHIALLAGLAGCVLMYAINAQKVVLLLPLAMMLVHMQLRSRSKVLTSMAVPLLVFAAATIYATMRWEEDVVAGVLALFLVHRTIATPGLTLSQYFDQFSTEAFTFWSHVKGIDFFVDVPTAYASDPLWPGLGYMLGDRLFGRPEFNMNANLFAGDGIAAAGAVGVLVIGLVLIAFLFTLDAVSRRWDQRFVVLTIFPIGLSLTNGHLFTALLSFGGLFWLLTFFLAGRSVTPTSRTTRVVTHP